MPRSSTEMPRTVKNERRRHIHYQRQAREGRLVSPVPHPVSIDFLFSSFQLGFFLTSPVLCVDSMWNTGAPSQHPFLPCLPNYMWKFLSGRFDFEESPYSAFSSWATWNLSFGPWIWIWIVLGNWPGAYLQDILSHASLLREFCKHGLTRPRVCQNTYFIQPNVSWHPHWWSPSNPTEGKKKPSTFHFIFAFFLQIPFRKRETKKKKKRLRCCLSSASLDETLFMGKIFYWQFQEKGSLSAINGSPTLFEFQQISTNEHS